MMRALTVWAAAAALLVFLPADAHFQTGEYTHKDSTCAGTWENRVDPINFVFYSNAYGGRVKNNIEYHAGWYDTSGSGQYFYSHGSCYFMKFERASGCGWCSRYHIRVKGIPDYDSYWGWTAVGDAHHEDAVYCGHAVDKNGSNGSGFDQGRRQLRQRFTDYSDPHLWWDVVDWVNTHDFKQCDGDYAGSDGRVVRMWLHSYFH